MPAEEMIFVIDDNEAVRDALDMQLSAAGYLVSTFASALAFLEAYEPAWRGCIVADVRMPGMSGIELQHELARRGIPLPVVIITGHADVPMAVAALKAGAVDFIEKPFRDEVLIASLGDALARGPATLARFSSQGARFTALTAREREILDLLVAGHSSKAIGAILDISPRTVDVHRAHIMDKAKANSIVDLVRLACETE
ncbi:MAG: response regulator [Magnetospirillum sp. WYHS-4]